MYAVHWKQLKALGLQNFLRSKVSFRILRKILLFHSLCFYW